MIITNSIYVYQDSYDDPSDINCFDLMKFYYLSKTDESLVLLDADKTSVIKELNGLDDLEIFFKKTVEDYYDYSIFEGELELTHDTIESNLNSILLNSEAGELSYFWQAYVLSHYDDEYEETAPIAGLYEDTLHVYTLDSKYFYQDDMSFYGPCDEWPLTD